MAAWKVVEKSRPSRSLRAFSSSWAWVAMMDGGRLFQSSLLGGSIMFLSCRYVGFVSFRSVVILLSQPRNPQSKATKREA